jgi:yecA family protein
MAYQTINQIFRRYGSDMTPAEGHGLATGMLCIESKIEAANWLVELLEEDILLNDEDKTILVSLFEQTRKLLGSEDDSFSYDLFLPGDDEPLNQKLEAIRSWCEGFLFGVGHTQSSSEWTGETGEIMKDIVEFTKLEVDAYDEMGDDDETALMEIQEYLRVAVMTVRGQFFEQNSGHQH